jgi:hypothetical protein
MMRTLYRFLVWLHPLEFRVEFGGEMLWIFDEAAVTVGVLPLLYDALVSLARQWLLRSDAWKFGVGVIVNATLVTVLFGGPGVLDNPRKQAAPNLYDLEVSWDRLDAFAHPTRLYLMVQRMPWAGDRLNPAAANAARKPSWNARGR